MTNACCVFMRSRPWWIKHVIARESSISGSLHLHAASAHAECSRCGYKIYSPISHSATCRLHARIFHLPYKGCARRNVGPASRRVIYDVLIERVSPLSVLTCKHACDARHQRDIRFVAHLTKLFFFVYSWNINLIQECAQS